MAGFLMKTAVSVTLAAVSFLTTAGQTPWDKMCGLFASSCVEISCSYEGSYAGTLLKGEALLTVQGKSFRMSGNGLEVSCDGNSIWTVDNEAKEAVIEAAEDALSGNMGNPALILVRLDDLFEVRDVSSDGVTWTYSLSAKVDCGIKKADVAVTSAGILRHGTFSLSDGNVLKARILSMKETVGKPESFFRPCLPSDPSWTVTDLR